MLCALGVGLAVGMPFERAIEGVARVMPPEGRMQLVDGGDGGHKGMRLIIVSLGTDELPRVKIGVGRGGDLRQNRARVLEKFSQDELLALVPGLVAARGKLSGLVAEIVAAREAAAASGDLPALTPEPRSEIA